MLFFLEMSGREKHLGGRGPVPTRAWNYVSSSKAAEAAEVTGKCAVPATALGSLP